MSLYSFISSFATTGSADRASTTLTLSAANVRRLVLVAVVVAAKFSDDHRCLNSYYGAFLANWSSNLP